VRSPVMTGEMTGDVDQLLGESVTIKNHRVRRRFTSCGAMDRYRTLASEDEAGQRIAPIVAPPPSR